ncbi:MAG: Smr/MutS family protein [Myxococcaceae bacterium]|nr:Smr/MutS family protein [Myxococcaceae bacterium]MCI0670656.1 Smr/MutS family protein [Myxococcaceae bacterium]
MADRGKPTKKDAGFNTPFKGLKLKVETPAPARPPPAPPKATPPRRAEPKDAELFLEAMDGVRPLTDRGSVVEPQVPLPARVDENAEALAQLAELVSGHGRFDIADTDEFIEGCVPGLDARLLRSLRRGDFAVQGHVDLHGLTQAEAKEALERYLTESRRVGRRCVVVVHGRGLHSKDQIPVLKERMRVWLTQGRIARQVLAFTTARPHDGGAGAVYVLLRR